MEGWIDDFEYENICGCTDEWTVGFKIKEWNSLPWRVRKKFHEEMDSNNLLSLKINS